MSVAAEILRSARSLGLKLRREGDILNSVGEMVSLGARYRLGSREKRREIIRHVESILARQCPVWKNPMTP